MLRRLLATKLRVELLPLVLWPLLTWSSVDFVVTNLLLKDTRLNLALVCCTAGLLLYRILQQRLSVRLQLHYRLLPLLCCLLLGLFYVYSEHCIGIKRVSVFTAGLGFYALLGLYLPRSVWHRGLWPCLLLLVALPNAMFLDIYLGFPARQLTADIVHGLLPTGHLSTISASTILVFEKSAAQIDLPCSGVKSLWAGAVFSLALIWLERRRISIALIACNGIFLALLFAANITRVFLLVYVGLVLQWSQVARLIHLPLGVLGFVFSGWVLLSLLRLTRSKPCSSAKPYRQNNRGQRPLLVGLTTLLVSLMLVVHLLPAATQAVTQSNTSIKFQPEILLQPLPLGTLEQQHFANQGAVVVKKYRFAYNRLGGTLLLVKSHSYRAHHPPHRCLTGAGFTIEAASTVLLEPDFPVRLFHLGNHPGAAVSWFQSPNSITEDYTARVWQDVSGKQRRWMLVSMVFDKSKQPTADKTQEFISLIRQTVAQQWQP